MTPEEAKQWIGEIVSRIAYRDNGYLNSTQNAYSRDIAEQSQTKSRQVAALIESLVAERGALAEQVRLMREALDWSKVHVEYVADLDAHSDKPTGEATVALRLMEVALALTPTAAEEQAKENAEKAALLDWATTRMETHNEYVFPAFGPTSQHPDCRFAWFRYDRKGPAYETAYDALRAAREASDD